MKEKYAIVKIWASFCDLYPNVSSVETYDTYEEAKEALIEESEWGMRDYVETCDAYGVIHSCVSLSHTTKCVQQKENGEWISELGFTENAGFYGVLRNMTCNSTEHMIRIQIQKIGE